MRQSSSRRELRIALAIALGARTARGSKVPINARSKEEDHGNEQIGRRQKARLTIRLISPPNTLKKLRDWPVRSKRTRTPARFGRPRTRSQPVSLTPLPIVLFSPARHDLERLVRQRSSSSSRGARSPRGERPRCRTILVVTAVSSKKTRRGASSLDCSTFSSARAAATSGRSCSAACRVFLT